jgi:hypothetical protein
MRVDGNLEQRFDGRVIYRLPDGSRRSRKNAFMHVGRHCGTRVRPVSAFMFSNKTVQATPMNAAVFALLSRLLLSPPLRQLRSVAFSVTAWLSSPLR